MKKGYTLIVFSFVLLFFTSNAFAQKSAEAINWSSNLDFGKLVAQKYGKPLFLFFVDVPPNAISKSVYDSTLSNPIVANKVNDSFIPVRIQGDTILDNEYNVSRFPTLLILDPVNFSEISRLTGIMSAPSVFELMQNALDSVEAEIDVPGDDAVDDRNNENTDLSSGLIYKYENGAFIDLGEDNWVHSSSFYPRINFTQFHKDENHWFIANRDLKVYFAIPRKEATTFWLWKKTKNENGGSNKDTWIYAGKIESIKPGSLSDYISENSLIGQEN